jgi:hypothetical protein
LVSRVWKVKEMRGVALFGSDVMRKENVKWYDDDGGGKKC